MCGSFYTLRGRISYIRMMFPDDVADPLVERLIEIYKRNPPERKHVPWPPNYYVRPTNRVLAFVGNEDAEIEPREYKWGHAPSRYRSKQPLFNARGETLDDKATWHEPWHTGRCLIPARGFYEWVAKQPHAVQSPQDEPLLFAHPVEANGPLSAWVGALQQEAASTLRGQLRAAMESGMIAAIQEDAPQPMQ